MAMRTILLLAASAALAGGAMAAGYKESVSGDLSNNRSAPTGVALKTGLNEISGNFGARRSGGQLITDRDYFRISIPQGKALTAIFVGPPTSIGGSASFIGIQSGPQITVPPNGGSPADLLGWSHFTTADEGTDILPQIGMGEGAIGFAPPLGPGVYSFWVQETSICNCSYQFGFQVRAVAADGQN
jgi:hypothetical protein